MGKNLEIKKNALVLDYITIEQIDDEIEDAAEKMRIFKLLYDYWKTEEEPDASDLSLEAKVIYLFQLGDLKKQNKKWHARHDAGVKSGEARRRKAAEKAEQQNKEDEITEALEYIKEDKQHQIDVLADELEAYMTPEDATKEATKKVEMEYLDDFFDEDIPF